MLTLPFQVRKSRKDSPGSRRRMRVLREKRKTGLTKRRRFVLVAALLSLGLVVIQSLTPDRRLAAFVLYFLVAYGLSAWSLIKDLNGIEWITNLILPAFYPVAVGLFYFLLPQASATRIIVIVLFALGMYALLLTSNIFAVASIRTIQLLRAARAVGFLLTVLTAAFMFHLILSFKLGFALIFVLVFVVSFPLYLQGLWGSLLESTFSRRLIVFSLISALVTAEFAMAVAFWPIDVAMGSIFLSMVLYALLGLFQHHLEDRLFRKTVDEYLGFAAMVFVVVVISVLLRWQA